MTPVLRSKRGGRRRTDFGAKLLAERIRRAAPKPRRPCTHRRQRFDGERLPCAHPQCDHGIGGNPTLVVAKMPKAPPDFASWNIEDHESWPTIRVEKVYFKRERWRDDSWGPFTPDYFLWSEPQS